MKKIVQKTRKRIQSPIKQKVLMLLQKGIEINCTRVATKQIRLFGSIPREWRQIDRQYLYRIINEFHHERLVDWQERSDGTIKLILSENGKLIAKQFNPDNLKINKPTSWDKRWHVVIYDIPISKNAARNALRAKLTEMGFKEWQKSVFIHPYPCLDEVNFIIEFFDVRPYVRYAELINPTNEAELKLYFKL